MGPACSGPTLPVKMIGMERKGAWDSPRLLWFWEKHEQESSQQPPGRGQGLGSRTVLQPQPKAFAMSSYHLVTQC